MCVPVFLFMDTFGKDKTKHYRETFDDQNFMVNSSLC